MSVINVENLTFGYDGSADNIFENVSFRLDTDWKLGFTGRNGRGKTTFLNLLTRIYYPTKGELYIDNEPADPSKHSLAVVFQEPSYMPWLTVEKNLRFGLEIKKLPKEEIDARVENIINLLGACTQDGGRLACGIPPTTGKGSGRHSGCCHLSVREKMPSWDVRDRASLSHNEGSGWGERPV